MDDFVAALLTTVVGLITVPVAVFFIEVTAATATTLARRFGASAKEVRGTLRPRIAVLITAHNESVGLTPILEEVKQQVQPDDRILVVADNCTDDTASIASAHGVQVIERRDMTKRDKGFAFDFGIRHLALDPPEILIMLGADCRLADNAIYELAMTCAATCRPVQALYRMLAPSDSSNNLQVAEFTWRVKNWLRPLGLKALGLPCQLMGTGMAFPWDAIRRVDLASSWSVEDLKLGIVLASQGRHPLFCPTARVTSQFGASATAVRTQRACWEPGHVKMILSAFPRLLCAAIAARDWRVIALALDLTVPPLSLLAIIVVATLACTAVYALLGFSSTAFSLCAGTAIAFLVATFLAWITSGRDLITVGDLLLIARYGVDKVRHYRVIVSKQGPTTWMRIQHNRDGSLN